MGEDWWKHIPHGDQMRAMQLRAEGLKKDKRIPDGLRTTFSLLNSNLSGKKVDIMYLQEDNPNRLNILVLRQNDTTYNTVRDEVYRAFPSEPVSDSIAEAEYDNDPLSGMQQVGIIIPRQGQPNLVVKYTCVAPSLWPAMLEKPHY